MKIIMKKHILSAVAALVACAVAAPAAVAAGNDEVKTTYRRSSLCSILISRTDQQMYDKIQQRFLEIPTPDQYNNHDLSIRMLNVSKKKDRADSIDTWLKENKIASRLVAKWFNRDIVTGQCDMNLVQQRGLYNATEMDKELAARSARGQAMLADAGEELIGNTFVLVHEAHYIDNAKRSKNVGTGLKILGAVGSAFLGSSFGDLMDNLGDIAATFKGFRVKFHTRLYQLQWTEDNAGEFYSSMWNDRDAFEEGRSKFSLRYIGEVESAGSQNSFLGIREEEPELMIRKACQRAIDDNVRDLQAAYEEFRVKSPITGFEGDNIMVPIGMKEGVNEKSEYEVLEAEEKNGRIKYKRVGVVTPVAGRIWDNRFMAAEEGAVGSEFTATAFKVKSGKRPETGHFVRQISGK